tara:strand:+ start:1453 stop:2364 length:912 start_codon:yes stop_codon:yes gene_type:complete
MLKMQLTKGFTLIEVLVSLLVFTIGLLGYFTLQNYATSAQMEASNRVKATQLVEYMVEQIKIYPDIADQCSVNNKVFGTGYALATNECGSYTTRWNAIVAWNSLLVGSEEKNADDNSIGGVTNGRGCIEYTAEVDTNTYYQPAKYTVHVAWQGFTGDAPVQSPNSCGYGEFGGNVYQRVVSSDILVPRMIASIPTTIVVTPTTPRRCGRNLGSVGTIAVDRSGTHVTQLTSDTTWYGTHKVEDLCLNGYNLTVRNGNIAIEEFNCHSQGSNGGVRGYITLDPGKCYVFAWKHHHPWYNSVGWQ